MTDKSESLSLIRFYIAYFLVHSLVGSAYFLLSYLYSLASESSGLESQRNEDMEMRTEAEREIRKNG